MKDVPIEPASNPKRLIPLTKWDTFHAWPPIGGLRHLVFHSHKNGFNACIVRIGRRVLIDETRFFAWVDSQKGVSKKLSNKGGN